MDGPRQRNARAENAPIPAGGGPAAWAAEPAKPPQKDGAARWTQKNAEGHYGSQNPVTADAKSKLIEREAGTAASVPDAQKLAALVAPVDGPGSAASAYRRAAAVARLAQKQGTSHIHERAYRQRPLSDAQKASNRQKSQLRARSEQGFGFMRPALKGFYLRSLGRRDNAAAIGVINRMYNLARSEPIGWLKLRPLAAGKAKLKTSNDRKPIHQSRLTVRKTPTAEAALKRSAPKTELQPATQLRKVVFEGSLKLPIALAGQKHVPRSSLVVAKGNARKTSVGTVCLNQMNVSRRRERDVEDGDAVSCGFRLYPNGEATLRRRNSLWRNG